MLTKNEDKHIAKCLTSVSFCNEVIVIDDNSTDATLAIARKLGAKIFTRELAGNWAKQRNFGLEKAKSKWVFYVDADEVVSSLLKFEILTAIKSDFDGFYFKRKVKFLGKNLKYGETANVKLLRLAKKNIGIWRRNVHEYWDINGDFKTLRNPLIHNFHSNLNQFISAINKMAVIHAQENAKEGKKALLIKVLFFPFGKFIVNYILLLGFLDGVRGFVFAVMMSFHSFLAWSTHYLIKER